MSHSTWLFVTILIILWTIPWKAWALWKSARKGDKAWFIIIFLVNTLAILEIFYLFVFSKHSKDTDASYQSENKSD